MPQFEIVTDLCIGCGLCIDDCFMKAITLRNNKALIDLSKCCGCEECLKNCPVEAINEINQK